MVYAAATVEAIAARAGAGKPTIYRWWPNRAKVIMDAFLAEGIPVEMLPCLAVVATASPRAFSAVDLGPLG